MPTFNLLPDIFVPTFEMKVNSAPLNPIVARSILAISVTEHLSPPSQFRFQLNDPKLKLIDAKTGLFTEGTRVEISLGFVGNTRKMIVGEISALTVDFPNSGPPSIQIEGFDLMHRLTRGTVYRTFGESDTGSMDSQIVTEIAGEASIPSSVDQTPTRKAPRTQNHKTNFAFLEELAEENDYFLWMDGDTLYFKSKQPAPNTIKLEWGKTLMSLSPRLSTAGQVNKLEVRGWDPVQRQSISAKAERSGPAAEALSPAGKQQIAKGTGGQSERVIVFARVSNTEDAQALAEKLLFEQNRNLIVANGSSAGPPGIRPGTILDLSGLGRFNGEYVVEQVTHSIDSGGYLASFEAKKRL